MIGGWHDGCVRKPIWDCGWENSTEYHCTPTKVFLKFSQSLRLLQLGSSHSIGSRANQLTGSIPSPTWSEKVHPHLPLGGDLREGTWYCRTRENKVIHPRKTSHESPPKKNTSQVAGASTSNQSPPPPANVDRSKASLWARRDSRGTSVIWLGFIRMPGK